MINYKTYHEIDTNPETNSKLAEIVNSIKANGWQGLPLLAWDDQLLNGCHRYTACEILGVEPEVYQLEIAENDDKDYRDYLIENLSLASDTKSLLNALKDLRDENLIDDIAVEIIEKPNITRRIKMEITKSIGRGKAYWGLSALPIGSEIVGTVNRGAGDVGALIQLKNGNYVQGNAGSIRTLARDEILAALNAYSFGRPPLFDGRMKQTAIRLPEEMVTWLKSQPGGMSETMRDLIKNDTKYRRDAMLNLEQQLEMVKNSKRTDKENYFLELLLTETADDFEQAYEAANIGPQTLREYVEQGFSDDEAGRYTLAMRDLFFERVDWQALTDYILGQR